MTPQRLTATEINTLRYLNNTMTKIEWAVIINIAIIVNVFALILLIEWEKESIKRKKQQKFKREHQHLSSWELFIRWFFKDYEK